MNYLTHHFASIPIPDLTELRSRRVGARSYPIDLTSVEEGEVGISVWDAGIAGENYYFRNDNPPYFHRAEGAIPELYVREGVLRRLLQVNSFLRTIGLELFLHDAYRPIEVQNYFHDEWVPAWLRIMHPEWSEEEIREETGNYWAMGAKDPNNIDPHSPPPHMTGGVVDLTLRKLSDGEFLPMGGAFDDASPVSFADHLEKKRERGELLPNEHDALLARRILYHAMTKAGFVVNPNEWWHFGHGDQLSAKLSGAPFALYSTLYIKKHGV